MTETNVNSRIKELADMQERVERDSKDEIDRLLYDVSECGTAAGLNNADFGRIRQRIVDIERYRERLREIDRSQREFRRP